MQIIVCESPLKDPANLATRHLQSRSHERSAVNNTEMAPEASSLAWPDASKASDARRAFRSYDVRNFSHCEAIKGGSCG